MKKLTRVLIIICILAVLIPASVYASFQVTYTWVDPLGWFNYSGTVGQLAVTDLDRNDRGYGYIDYGAAYWDENFSFAIDIKPTTMTADAYGMIWSLGNLLGSTDQMYNGGTMDFLDMYLMESAGDTYYVLRECNNQVLNIDFSTAATVGTTHYIRIRRDTAVGVFGTLYAEVYGNPEDRQDSVNDIVTYTVTLTEDLDWRYLYRVNSFDSGDAVPSLSFTQYKFYVESPLPSYELVAPSAIGGYYSHPYAAAYSGVEKRVYFTYLDYNGRVFVNYYDAVTTLTGTAFEIAQTAATTSWNEHGTPSLTVITSGAHQGKILVTWTDVDDGYVYARRSTNSEDTSAFDAAVTLGTGAAGVSGGSFVQPQQLSNGNIMLVYRWVVSNPPAYYQLRYRIWDNASDTWGAVVVLVDFHTCCGDDIAFYPVASTDGAGRVDVAWSTKQGGVYKQLWHTQSLNNGATWETIAGTPIVLPVDNAESDIVSLGVAELFVWDISYYGGVVNILFNQTPAGANPDKTLKCTVARDDGAGGWDEYIITDVRALYDTAPGVTSGMGFNRNDPHQIYVAAAVAPNLIEIQEWFLSDAGVASKTTDVTSGSLYGQIRPNGVVNLGLSSDILMWSSVDHNGGATTWMGFLSVDALPVIGVDLAVVTEGETNVEETSATLGGNITVLGGNAVGRGFVYDTTSHGDPGNTTPSGSGYSDWTSEIGSWGNVTFTDDLTGLDEGTCYYFRAWANTTNYGWVYGAQGSLLTKPGPPTGLTVTYVDWETFDIEWTKGAGDGAVYTVVTRKEGSNPTNYTDGEIVYDNTGSSFTDLGLEYGIDYHYCAWTYVTACGETRYSDSSSCDAGDTTSEASLVQSSEASVFRSYLEPTDMLFVVQYTNTYQPYYLYESVHRFFRLQLIDTDDTTVLADTACKQWGMRPGSIYISADQAASLTDGSAYTIRLYGTFDPYPTSDYTLQPSDWRGDDLFELDTWCLVVASRMETYYDPTEFTLYTGEEEVLNVTGGNIFKTGIPDLDKVRPNLFDLTTYKGYVKPKSDANPWAIDSEDMFGADITARQQLMADEFGIEVEVMYSINWWIVFAFMAALIGAATGMLAGVVIAFPLLIIGAFMGPIEMTMILSMILVVGLLALWKWAV